MSRMYRLEATSPKSLDVYIYGDIEGDYLSAMNGELIESKTSVKFFKEELSKYPYVKEINLYVNSWGGAVQEGFEIRDLLKNHPAKITGHVDGFAGSVASYILTGCDKVVMGHNTMQHLDNFSTFCVGNADQIRKCAADLDQYVLKARNGYLARANGKIEKKKLVEMMDNSSWLTAADCLELGLTDEIDDYKTYTPDLPDFLQQRFVKRNLGEFTQITEQKKTRKCDIEMMITNALKKHK